MKYRNPLTRELLKEFRRFQKWAPKGIYSMKEGKQEEEFNENIKRIISNTHNLKTR